MRVYPADCCAPCRAGFGTVRFAYAKAMARFSHNLVLCSRSARIRAKFYGNKKRRKSLHLSKRGSAKPKNDKRKRPTPQTGCCPWSCDQRPA